MVRSVVLGRVDDADDHDGNNDKGQQDSKSPAEIWPVVKREPAVPVKYSLVNGPALAVMRGTVELIVGLLLAQGGWLVLLVFFHFCGSRGGVLTLE
jgi:hypothetical protein